MVGSQAFSLSAPIFAMFGAGASIGASYSKDVNSKVINTTINEDFGTSVGPVNITTSAELSIDRKKEEKTLTGKAIVGSSQSGGIIMTGDFTIHAGMRIVNKD